MKTLVIFAIAMLGVFANAEEKIAYGLYKLPHSKNCFLAITPTDKTATILLTGVGSCPAGILTGYEYSLSSDGTGTFKHGDYQLNFSKGGLLISTVGKPGGIMVPPLNPSDCQ